MTDTKERQDVLEQNGRPSREVERKSDRVYTPRADILETGEAFWVRVDLPGVKPADVKLNCQEGQLILHAPCAPRHYGRRAMWREYGVGDYHRSFVLGEQVDGNNIEAVLADGVLTIRLPKTESARPRRIEVKGG